MGELNYLECTAKIEKVYSADQMKELVWKSQKIPNNSHLQSCWKFNNDVECTLQNESEQ